MTAETKEDARQKRRKTHEGRRTMQRNGLVNSGDVSIFYRATANA
jgi:hypothetical protein